MNKQYVNLTILNLTKIYFHLKNTKNALSKAHDTVVGPDDVPYQLITFALFLSFYSVIYLYRYLAE